MSGGPPAWCERYVGLPFSWSGESREGTNCWGLVRMVLAEQAEIELPSFEDHAPFPQRGDRSSMAELIDQGQADQAWKVVWERSDPSEPVPHDLALPFDCLRIRMFHHPHIGIVVAPGWMLHAPDRQTSVCERFKESRQWSHRISGIYRHPSVVTMS